MHKIKRLALMLALLVPFVAGPALADTPPPPEPDAPLTTVLEGGKVVAHIGTPRNADHAIGASIPIILVFELQHRVDPAKAAATDNGKAAPAVTPVPAAAAEPAPFDPAAFLADTAQAPTAPAAQPLAVPKVNVEGLAMGVLSAQPQDTVIIGKPVIQEYADKDKDYVRVVFWVSQFITTQKNADGTEKRQATISVDFLYAVDMSPDGHQPDWKKASTKEMIIDIVPSAGAEQSKMREGDLSAKESLRAPVIPYAIGLGVVLMLPLFGLLGWSIYAAFMRPRQLSANEIFWFEVDQVIKSATEAGVYELDDYQKIMFELRRRYDVAALYTVDLLKKLESEPHYKTIETVFALEEVFFVKDGVVTAEQHEELMSSLKLLIPRT